MTFDWLLPSQEALWLVQVQPQENDNMTQTLVYIPNSKCQKNNGDWHWQWLQLRRNPVPASYARYEILASSNLQSFLSLRL